LVVEFALFVGAFYADISFFDFFITNIAVRHLFLLFYFKNKSVFYLAIDLE
jgi:hypothetical protein